ncbi:MAG: hypothetical protein QNI91_05220 [Arenicellales bacterium]|nr:hypothetical protein [Arenicellales bacterium]
MRLLVVLIMGVMVSLCSLVQAQQTAPAPMTVKDLRDQGWQVKEMHSRNETRPGLPPYENLDRVVSITTYVLVRGNDTIICEIIYDSQQDSLQEHCEQDG